MNKIQSQSGVVLPASSGFFARYAWLFAASLMYVLTYAPLLAMRFVNEDEWRAFRYSSEPSTAGSRFHACAEMTNHIYFYTGRPLLWLGECTAHSWVAQIADFRILRVMVLPLLILTALAFARVASRYIGRGPGSLILGFSVVAAPGMTYMFLEQVVGTLVVLASAASVCSLLLFWGFLDRPSPLRIRDVGKLIAAQILFSVGLFIYPAFAFSAIPLIAVEFVFGSEKRLEEAAKRFVFALLFYVLSVALYFFEVKLLIAGHDALFGVWAGAAELNSSTHAFRASFSASRFLARLLELISDFGGDLPILNWRVPAVVAILAFSLGPFACFLRCKRLGKSTSTSLLWMLSSFAVVAIIIPGSMGPWIVSQFMGLGAHIELPLEILATFFVFIFVFEMSSFVKRKAGINIIVPSMLVIFAALCVHQFNLLSREATLSSRQLSFIEDNLLIDGRYKDAGTLKVIYLRDPSAYVGWFNDNIAKLNPVAYPWITTAVLRDLVSPSVMSNFEIVDCQNDQQCKAQPHGNKRIVLVAYADSLVYPLSPDSVVIHLDSLGAAEKGHPANLL